MSKEVWKFKLSEAKESIEMPIGAQILSVQVQSREPHLWALVDPKEANESRCFEVYGTGHPIHYDMAIERNYIGTIQTNEGRLVFHVFEQL